MVTKVPSGGLTRVERSLVDHVVRGEWLNLVPEGEKVDEAAMRSWDKSRTISAAVIRDILRGRLAPDPDPHGLRLRGAKITGRLDLENLSTDVNLELKDCFLEEGVVARDARLAGIALTGCQLEHPSEPPLAAGGLTCTVLDLSGARVMGHANAGIDLLSARIGAGFDCSGATVSNDSGPALFADGLQVGQAIFLRGFTASGTGEMGAVRLLGADAGITFECDGATLSNKSGPALLADGLQVGESVYLRNGFTATGAGEIGAVRLLGAHIGTQLDCGRATLSNDSGTALDVEGVQVGQNMFLTEQFTSTGGGAVPAVDLTSARVGGTLFFDPARLEHKSDPHRRLSCDGLTYTGVPQRIPVRDWLDLLRNGTPRYAAQPYQQLAAGYRAAGDDRQAREVLMAQRDDELTRTETRWTERAWGKITKITLGYGYQPWRALLFLAGVVLASIVLAIVLGAHGALAQTKDTASPGRPCTVSQRLSVGLDLNLPVGTSLARVGCDLTGNSASTSATWLSNAGWVLRVLGWVFAALFVAGFTSAVRKN